jgi:hypothetical protein
LVAHGTFMRLRTLTVNMILDENFGSATSQKDSKSGVGPATIRNHWHVQIGA